MSVLSEEQVELISSQYLEAREKEGREPDSEALDSILTWAGETFIAWAILQNLMDGLISPDFKEGEVVFSITDNGKKRVEQVISENDGVDEIYPTDLMFTPEKKLLH